MSDGNHFAINTELRAELEAAAVWFLPRVKLLLLGLVIRPSHVCKVLREASREIGLHP
jgi:hypothetical protein